jgi:hypothetical protein
LVTSKKGLKKCEDLKDHGGILFLDIHGTNSVGQPHLMPTQAVGCSYTNLPSKNSEIVFKEINC